MIPGERLAVDLELYRANPVPRGLRPVEPLPVEAQQTWFTGWTDAALPFVTSEQVLGLPAAWSCTLKIANAVASMAPPRVVGADGVEWIPTPTIAARPHTLYGPTEWWSMIAAHAVTSGNFVGILADFDPDTGYARQVVPVPTRAVNGFYRDGIPVYDIGGEEFGPWDVVHVRWLPVPGQVMGIGVVSAFRRSLGGAVSQQRYAANVWDNSAVPPGILKVNRPNVDDAKKSAKADEWATLVGGGSRTPVVLDELWDFTPIAWTPEDAQFLASRQFSVAEVALMFGFDPSDLGATLGGGGALTYANLTQRLTARIVEVYGPWLARFEDAWSDLVPGGNLVRFRRENYAHASRKELLDELEVGIRIGVLTAQDGRRELNLEPLPTPEVQPPTEPPPPPDPGGSADAAA